MVVDDREFFGASPYRKQCQMVSDLTDGHLLPGELNDVVRRLSDDDRALDSWRTYHVIGDALKTGNQPLPLVNPQFVSKVRARIDAEIVSSGRSAQPVMAHRFVVRPERPGRIRQADAANEAVFLWRAVAGVAVFVAVGALAWSAMESPGPFGGAQMAAGNQGNTSLQSVASGNTAILRDPVLDEMLAAHRQVSGASALQMPAGFVRNAAFEPTHR